MEKMTRAGTQISPWGRESERRMERFFASPAVVTTLVRTLFESIRSWFVRAVLITSLAVALSPPLPTLTAVTKTTMKTTSRMIGE